MQIQAPQNIIFTGVAGTGKTYRLQQLAKDYTEYLTPINSQSVLATLVEPLSWREVICLVFLEQKVQGKDLLKVGNIVEHAFFQAKAQTKGRTENLNQSVWQNLQQHSSPNSTTVNYKNRASQAYFDKDQTSSWYLLDESLPLLSDLQMMLEEYQNRQANETSQNASQNSSQINTPKKERFALVSFHQSYGYDEFVEGIRPIIDEQTGQMKYSIRKGVFLQLCEQAKQDPTHRYAMLIDEINRANVAQVFGELMSLIEPSKRAGQANAMSVRLAYSSHLFSVPSNIDIFASMNTQDHSLVSLDSAFRRRFEFVEMLPDSSVLGQVADTNGDTIDLGRLLDGLNARILKTLGKQYRLGQAYFFGVITIDQLLKVMTRQVLPQLLTHTTHSPQALVEILQLDKVPWMVTHQSLGQYGQTNYQINPDVSHVEGLFAMAQVFEALY